MKWSWKIGRIAGIDVFMHVTFLLLLAWVGASDYFVRGRWQDAASGLIFILCLFAIVVLHELGHALTARRFGVQTRDITLLPIGGVARLDRIPERPREELLVALAGPAVNVLLAVIFFGLLSAEAGLANSWNAAMVGGNFLSQMAWVNVVLAAFNLLPAFPMDGGRVLRASLASRMNYARATRIAANVGQGMAILFAIAGLFFSPILVFVALFVWLGARQEAGFVERKAALRDVPIERVMMRNAHTLSPTDSLGRAVEEVLASSQSDFPVVQDGEFVGVLTRPRLLNGLQEAGREVVVANYMDADFATVRPSDPAEAVFNRMQAENRRVLPVVEGARVVGFVTLERLHEFLSLQSALHTEKRAAPRVPPLIERAAV